jgi:hypothetical protein
MRQDVVKLRHCLNGNFFISGDDSPHGKSRKCVDTFVGMYLANVYPQSTKGGMAAAGRLRPLSTSVRVTFKASASASGLIVEERGDRKT